MCYFLIRFFEIIVSVTSSFRYLIVCCLRCYGQVFVVDRANDLSRFMSFSDLISVMWLLLWWVKVLSGNLFVLCAMANSAWPSVSGP